MHQQQQLQVLSQEICKNCVFRFDLVFLRLQKYIVDCSQEWRQFSKILSIIMTARTNLDFFVIFSLIWETKEVQSSLWQSEIFWKYNSKIELYPCDPLSYLVKNNEIIKLPNFEFRCQMWWVKLVILQKSIQWECRWQSALNWKDSSC